MSRKNITKIIAVTFIAFGIWYFGAFFRPMFFPPHDTNLLYILISPFYLGTGYELLKFKNSGRNLAIILLFLNAVEPMLLMLLVVIVQAGSTFHINIKDLEWNPLKLENYYIITAWASQAAIDLLAILFFLQKRTKELFLVEEKMSVEIE